MNNILIGVLLSLVLLCGSLGLSTHHYYKLYVVTTEARDDLQGELDKANKDKENLKETKAQLENIYAEVVSETQALKEGYDSLATELEQKKCVAVIRSNRGNKTNDQNAKDQTDVIAERDFVISVSGLLQRAYDLHQGSSGDISTEGINSGVQGSSSGKTN